MNLLTEGKFYGFIVLEILIKHGVKDLQAHNIINWGLTEDQISIGLEYLTLTTYRAKGATSGYTQ